MRVSAAAVMLVALLPQYAAASNKHSDKQQPTEEQPDAELLEFIAEFEPLDGQWIDPIQLSMIFAKNRNDKDND
jgi:hypothetical protein